MTRAASFTIIWTPKNIQLTLGLGDIRDIAASFVSNTNMSDVDLWVVPELQPFVRLAPNHFDTVVAGSSYSVSIHFSVPLGTGTRLYDGTIHARIGSATYPQTLKIKLNIVTAAKTIGSAGGEVITPDLNVNLQIPPGALDADTLITICYDDGNLNLGQLGNMISLGPEGTIFQIPAALIVTYDPSSLPYNANERDILFGRLGDFDTWEVFENFQLDITNNRISSLITHFSTFGVLYSIFTDTSGFKLRFPLDNYTPQNVPISAFFDHNHTSPNSYYPDGKISAFSGEIAIGRKDSSGTYTNASQWYYPSSFGRCYGFSNNCSTSFYGNGNYTGGGEADFLFYDGHPGIDFPVRGVIVKAAEAGTVHYGRECIGGVWLNEIWIDHKNGYKTRYLHLSTRLAGDGLDVGKGDVIGVSGQMACPGDPQKAWHLHFEVQYNSVPVDPYGWGGFYSDPYKRVNPYLWEVGSPIKYKNIPSEYKCDSDNDGIPDEIDQGVCDTYEFQLKWGSYGTGNGQFYKPSGIAVDSNGFVYVSDFNNRIQKFDSNGNFITKWGSYGTGNGQFDMIWDIAVDSNNIVYALDFFNYRIQKFDSNGNFITKWGSKGSGDGQFFGSYGIAVDSSGFVYVADAYNYRIQKFDSNGNFITKWGSIGSGDGQFLYPCGIAADKNGNVYVVDYNKHQIQKFSSNGNFLGKWGNGGSGDGQFHLPWGIAVGSNGFVYVADTYNYRIQKFDSKGNFITTWGNYGSGDGQFNIPWRLSVNLNGDVYVCEIQDNHRIQKFVCR